MPDNGTLLTILETRILARLNPLLIAGGGTLQQIAVESMASADDLPVILERYRSRMPGGFLSLPLVRFEESATRIINATLDYAFLAGWASRDTNTARRPQAFAFVEDFGAAISLRSLSTAGAPLGNRLNFTRLNEISFAEDPEAGLTAMLAKFQIGVRNWILNEPDR